LLFGLKGDCAILSVCFCLLFTGCGVKNRDMGDINASIPPSHRHVEEMVIGRALENCDFPPGHGARAAIAVETGGSAGDILRLVAPEVITRRGYTIIEDEASAGEFRLAVDTLHVTLTPHDGGLRTERIRRSAVAVVTVVFIGGDGSRRVYKSEGTYEDIYRYRMMKNDSNDPHVRDLVSEKRLIGKMKPLVIGVAMTLFAWALYSYRG